MLRQVPWFRTHRVVVRRSVLRVTKIGTFGQRLSRTCPKRRLSTTQTMPALAKLKAPEHFEHVQLVHFVDHRGASHDWLRAPWTQFGLWTYEWYENAQDQQRLWRRQSQWLAQVWSKLEGGKKVSLLIEAKLDGGKGVTVDWSKTGWGKGVTVHWLGLHTWLYITWWKEHWLVTKPMHGDFVVTLSDGSTSSKHCVQTLPQTVVLWDFSEEQSFTVFPLFKYGAILGKPWLCRINP